jgi:hypothetical protein
MQEEHYCQHEEQQCHVIKVAITQHKAKKVASQHGKSSKTMQEEQQNQHEKYSSKM